MDVRGDERAVSVQIGAVLLLAILVSALALWQVDVVPVENEEVEIDHHAAIQSQLLDVRNGIVSAPGGSRGFSQTVSLGTTYPQRSFLVNPPDPTGTLRTVGTTNDSIAVGIANANATDDARAVWNGTGRTFGTGALVYEPNYNEFRSAPTTVYENSMLYDRYESDATAERTGQRLVDGNQISIVTLDGQYDRTARSTALDVETVSSSTNTVSVRNETENVTITIPSQRSVDDWKELLREEEQLKLTNQSGHVVGVESTGDMTADGVTYNLLEIRLEPGVTYELQMAKVGIGSGVESESSAYLTKQGGDGATIEIDEDHELVVEVRDEYNNPVSDVEVNATMTGHDVAGSVETQAETGGDGRATLAYSSSVETADGDPDTIEVTVTDDRGNARSVEFTVEVSDPSAIDGGGSGGGGTYNVSWNTTRIDSREGISCDSGSCTYDIASDPVALTMVTTPSVAGANVDYSIEGAGVELSPSNGETDSNGENATTLAADNASAGDVVSVHANSGGDGDTLQVELVSPPSFNVTIDETNSPVDPGKVLKVNATVENIGGETGTQDIEFDFDGTVENAEAVSLGPEETTSITFEYNTSEEGEGDHEVAVSSENDTVTTNVTIIGDSPYFKVSNFRSPSSAMPGETITVNATIENRGGEAGTQTIEYRFDGTAEHSQDVFLNASESTTIKFDYTILSDRAEGDYSHGVFSDDSKTATIEVVKERSVYAVGDSALESNGQLSSSFTVETGEGTYNVEVNLARSGNSDNWNTKQVLIDETVLELEAVAAADIGRNLDERDLLKEGTYAGGDLSILQNIRDEVDNDTQIDDEQNNGDVDLNVMIDTT